MNLHQYWVRKVAAKRCFEHQSQLCAFKSLHHYVFLPVSMPRSIFTISIHVCVNTHAQIYIYIYYIYIIYIYISV